MSILSKLLLASPNASRDSFEQQQFPTKFDTFFFRSWKPEHKQRSQHGRESNGIVLNKYKIHYLWCWRARISVQGESFCLGAMLSLFCPLIRGFTLSMLSKAAVCGYNHHHFGIIDHELKSIQCKSCLGQPQPTSPPTVNHYNTLNAHTHAHHKPRGATWKEVSRIMPSSGEIGIQMNYCLFTNVQLSKCKQK